MLGFRIQRPPRPVGAPGTTADFQIGKDPTGDSRSDQTKKGEGRHDPGRRKHPQEGLEGCADEFHTANMSDPVAAVIPLMEGSRLPRMGDCHACQWRLSGSVQVRYRTLAAKKGKGMVQVLLAASLPAVLAAGLDSAGLGLVAWAGVVWAASLYICSSAPVVAGQSGRSINEAVASVMEMIAIVIAVAGIAAFILGW